MSKNFRYFLVALLVLSVSAVAGTKKVPMAKIDHQTTSDVFKVDDRNQSVVITYTLIDSMANGFGPGNINVNPIAYDPYSNSVVIVHRGRTVSGQILYAYSTNGGTTWSNKVGPMQGGLAGNTNGRYPSIALHNPSKAADKDSVLVQVVFPLLVGGAFGGMIYSTDPGVGAGSPLASIDSAGVPWSSQMSSGSVYGSSNFIFAAYNGSDAGHMSIFRTTDGVTFTKLDPPAMAATKYYPDGNLDDASGVVYQGGNFYVALYAAFDAAAPSDTGAYTLGVSKSTDGGATWSEFDIVPRAGLTPAYATNRGYRRIGNDFTVDANGGYHWLITEIDTLSNPDKWSVFHYYKAAGGSWTATKVRDLAEHRNYSYGTLDQTRTENMLALSVDGKTLVGKWIEDGRGATYADSLPVADVWTAQWKAGAGWSTPVNRTNTPDINDQLVHMAPNLNSQGQALFFRSQALSSQGNTAAIDIASVVNGVYFSKETVVGVRKEDGMVAGSFNLSQNFPNPFNPTTNIQFSIPSSALTTLKVYNMVGQEVATLVNGQKEAGVYFVDFDASKLASGVYLYKLQSGSYVETKKMVLVK